MGDNNNSDVSDIYGNIYMDPMFVNQDSLDYRLQLSSPCIDAGYEQSSLNIDGSITDMGAFLSVLFGCTDELSCNYNNIATFEDTTCIYLQGENLCESCSGETDGTGYILSNDQDNDGICDADEQEGCKDQLACNYNEGFTIDINNDLCVYISVQDYCANVLVRLMELVIL